MRKKDETKPVQKVDQLLKKTKDAVEESSKEIGDIVTDTKENIHRLKDELIEIEARIAAQIMMVDSAERELSDLRKKVDTFEKTLGKDHPEIKKIYKKIKEVNMRSESLRNEEKTLRIRRDSLERFLRENGELLLKSEKAFKQILVAISYLNIEAIPSSESSIVRIIDASDAEKERMSRDIHDGPAQSLVNIMLKAEYADKMVESASTTKLKSELREIKVIAKDTLADIRRIIFDLMPYGMEEYGLVDTIQTLVQREESVNITLDIKENSKIATRTIENNLFRVIQEIYFNIVKHSNAKEAVFRIIISKKEISIYAKDEGVGFDVEKASKGYGLISMRDRVELLNGEITIVSKKGKGTEISITVPNVEDYEKNIRSR